MGEQDITFPMDVTDPSRPWKFKPEGYLVVILTGISEARRALSALVEGGFGDRDIKVYSGEQILENDAVNMRRRAVASRFLGPVTAQTSGRDLYLGYAREGRALWLRLPNEDDVSKALRSAGRLRLSSRALLDGFNKWEDFLASRASSNRSQNSSLPGLSRSCAEPWTYAHTF